MGASSTRAFGFLSCAGLILEAPGARTGGATLRTAPGRAALAGNLQPGGLREARYFPWWLQMLKIKVPLLSSCHRTNRFYLQVDQDRQLKDKTPFGKPKSQPGTMAHRPRPCSKPPVPVPSQQQCSVSSRTAGGHTGLGLIAGRTATVSLPVEPAGQLCPSCSLQV